VLPSGGVYYYVSDDADFAQIVSAWQVNSPPLLRNVFYIFFAFSNLFRGSLRRFPGGSKVWEKLDLGAASVELQNSDLYIEIGSCKSDGERGLCRQIQ